MKKYMTAHEFEVGMISGLVFVGTFLAILVFGFATVLAECLELACL